MDDSPQALARRRRYILVGDESQDDCCAYYLNFRNGDGVYQCMRTAVRWCEKCYTDTQEDRPFCKRHTVCDSCSNSVPIKKRTGV